MRKGEECDTELGMLTYKGAKLKVVSTLVPICPTFYPYGKTHMCNLDKLKRENFCYSWLNKALTGQKGY